MYTHRSSDSSTAADSEIEDRRINGHRNGRSLRQYGHNFHLRRQVEEGINYSPKETQGKLKVYLKEAPLVTVRIVNYRISVLGEVAKPGSFVISNEKINLLEALAMAGDLTIYGMRDNVKLIRTGQDNKQEIITLDLNKAETVLSPYYQLQQNDIIYVTPNKTKAKNSDVGTSTGLWFSGVSILVSLATLLVTILK